MNANDLAPIESHRNDNGHFWNFNFTVSGQIKASDLRFKYD